MKAKEARKITEEFVRAKLDNMEFGHNMGVIIDWIKKEASHGNSSLDYSINKKKVRDLCIKELENLGYKIIEHDDNYLLIQW